MRMESDEHEVLPPKAKQMYQAVLEMISEGDDVGVITVSGITTRAGIGKGTAYEYFKSKEELIGKALEWNFRTQKFHLPGARRSSKGMGSLQVVQKVEVQEALPPAGVLGTEPLSLAA